MHQPDVAIPDCQPKPKRALSLAFRGPHESIILATAAVSGLFIAEGSLIHIGLFSFASASAVSFYILARRILVPLQHARAQIQALTHFELHSPVAAPGVSLRDMVAEIARVSQLAVEYHRRNHEVEHELCEARRAITRFSMQHQTLLSTTTRECSGHYRAVLAYANYLEERVMVKQADPSLRYDFDDVFESSFSLSLMTSALNMLNQPGEVVEEDLPLALLLQRTLIKLAPALDRRNMKLDSSAVDMAATARGDANLIMHVVWMMLFGIIRYAQDESTLRLRTLTSHDGRQAIFSIVISELCPSTLSESERADYLRRHMRHGAPHLFANAVREHGNVQLASLLLAHTNGQVHVEPLTATSCELSLVLPTAY